jgi:hypothetical protein
VAGRTPKACRGRWQEVRKDRSPVPTLFKSGGLVKKRDSRSRWKTEGVNLKPSKIGELFGGPEGICNESRGRASNDMR